MACRLGLACVLVGACGKGGGGSAAERDIAAGLARELGVPVERVRCPAGPYPKRCAAEVPESPPIEVRVVEGYEGLEWSIDGFVIATAPLAAQIAIELDDLGVEAEVDCGPRYLTTAVGARIACTLDLGEGRTGAAWARIDDDDATFSLELALDPATVAARTRAVDIAELERRSRALDVDHASGDGDESAVDAGATDPASPQ